MDDAMGRDGSEFPLRFCVVAFVAAVVCGVASALAAYFFGGRLVVLSAVALGWLIYFPCTLIIRYDLVRSRNIVLTVGVLAGLTAVVVDHAVSAVFSRRANTAELIEFIQTTHGVKLEQAKVLELLDEVYAEETGCRGLLGAALYDIKTTRITKLHGAKKNQADVGGWGGGVFSGLMEIGLVVGLLFSMLRSRMAAPFCEACQAWKVVHAAHRVGDFSCHVNVLAALQAKDWEALCSVASQSQASDKSYTELKIHRCEHCEGDVDVELTGYDEGGKFSKAKTVNVPDKVALTSEEYARLCEAILVQTPAA